MVNFTKMGSINNRGMLVAALPASSNKTITSLIRFRMKITVKMEITVIMVEMIASAKNVLIRLFPIVSSWFSRTSTE